jgi:hypothetical protein
MVKQYTINLPFVAANAGTTNRLQDCSNSHYGFIVATLVAFWAQKATKAAILCAYNGRWLLL